jgi:plastocyanin
VGPRKYALAIAVLALGASVGVMPAIAGSEAAPTIEAQNSGPPGYYHYWVPPTARIAPGGSVTFSNPTAVPHGVEWIKPPATPACASSVPVGNTESAAGTNWSGSCTFSQPGVYTFYCTVHGASMSGTVTVEAGGTTSTSPGTTPTTPTTTTTPGGTKTTPGSTNPGGYPPPGSSTGTGPAGVPLYSALALGPRVHGAKLRGSLNISSADAGATLSVTVRARRGALAAGGGSVAVGTYVRHRVPAGHVLFAVPLTRRARLALAHRGRLAVSVTIVITPVAGKPAAVTRSLVLRS